MATRSDFAQKLLTDLQMRKERMAGPAAQSTGKSRGMPRDSYGNQTQQYKGSRQTKSLEPVTNPKRRSNRGARSPTVEESSSQIVPYGAGGNSEQIGDLSRALAFAFGSSTKSNSSSNNPVLSFLHRIGRKALEIGKMERRNSSNVNKPSTRIKNLSSIHINEISKGAQKLNQILRACSSGISFDGHSVEIGRELLKGAMDLEESLRMLANVQEASEQVIKPKRKSRIKLLDENGEEEKEEEMEMLSSVSHQKLVERPRFSFDKPSRNSQGTKSMINNDTKRCLMAIEYMSTSDVVSHKRSASCVSDFRSEKGRMSNVIAKLMGLDEVPQSVDFVSTPSRLSSKQKEDIISKSSANTNGKTVVKMGKNAEYVAPTASGKKAIQNQDSFISPNRKPLFNGFERVEATKLVSRSQVNEESHRFNKSRNDMHMKMRRHDTVQHKGNDNDKGAEAKSIRKGTGEIEIRLEKGKRNTDREEKPRVGKIEQQHMKENQVVPNKRSSKQLHDEKPSKVLENGKHKSDPIRYGKFMSLNANARNLMFGTSKETLPERKNSKASISHIKNEKHIQMHTTESSPRKDEAIMKIKPQNTIMAIGDPISTSQKREQLSPNKLEASAMLIEEAEDLLSQIVVADLPNTNETLSERNNSKVYISHIKEEKHIQMRKKESTPSKDDVITKTNRKQQNTIMATENPISTSQKQEQLSPNKLESRALLIQEAEELQSPIVVADLPTINETLSERNNSKVFISHIKEEKHIQMHEKESSSSKDEAITKTNRKQQNTIMATENPISTSQKQEQLSPNKLEANAMLIEEAEDLTSPIVVADLPTPNESSQDMATEISTDPIENKDLLPSFSDSTGLDDQKLELHSGNACNEDSFDHSKSADELLTESQMHLKETLLQSRLFLNTADAIFNLSIPDDILNVTDYISQDNDGNVMLDCAYEIMRRKGTIKEKSLYPSLKISIDIVKLTSFNDLVKQLQTDLEKLEVLRTSEDQDTAECIQEMLERDVQNRDPNLNFMWDLGWDEVEFAILERAELVKDVERYLIDGVVNDIAKELLHLNAYV